MDDSSDAQGDPLEADLLPFYNQGHPNGPIVVDDWAGGMPETKAQFPSIRVGRRWFSSLWIIPLALVFVVLSVAVLREMRGYQWMQSFIATYPGTTDSFVAPVENGFPWWLRWQHFFNLLFMMFIIRAGIQILADHPRLYLNSGTWHRMDETAGPGPIRSVGQ